MLIESMKQERAVRRRRPARRRVLALAGIAAGMLTARPASGQVADWPGVFDPLTLHRLNLEMEPGDWQIVQTDQTFEQEVPAFFWADGEEPLLVAVRRKSASALTENPSFIKVSLKIDINEYIVGQTWHDLHKLSLENGDDQDVVSEGMAWLCHRLASGPIGYDYTTGLANWVTVTINGTNTGVYVNQEQPDKQWFRNRNLYVADHSWLYKKSDVGPETREVPGPLDPPSDSPAHLALCYAPFKSPGECPTPDAATLPAELSNYINVRGMMTLGAVNAFVANPDEMFNHQKNFWYADVDFGPTRMYLPWDLDSSMPGGGLNGAIYGSNTPYETILLGNPTLRALYSEILNGLICGPLSAQNLNAFLDALEPILTPSLDADLNNRMNGDVPGHFDSMRAWYTQRVPIVAAQIEGFTPCPSAACPADMDGDGDADASDLAAWEACLAGPGGGLGAQCQCADTDFDGDADLRDFAALQIEFTRL